MENMLTQMGREIVVAVASTAEQLDNILLHTQQIVTYTLLRLQGLPERLSRGVHGEAHRAHSATNRVRLYIKNSNTHYHELLVRDLQGQLYLIDTNRQKLQGELKSKFPELTERLFSHDFCTMEDDLKISMKLANWSKPGYHPSTQLYDIGDYFSALDSIPSTLEPYKPLIREEVGVSSQEGESTYLDGWQNYLKQRSYPKPT